MHEQEESKQVEEAQEQAKDELEKGPVFDNENEFEDFSNIDSDIFQTEHIYNKSEEKIKMLREESTKDKEEIRKLKEKLKQKGQIDSE